MQTETAHAQPSISRLAQALLIGAGLLLVGLLMACALLAVAIEERVLQPPQFVIHLGHYYVTAPCPAATLVCDSKPNYYAVWVGQDLPDGRIHFDEKYFTYLHQKH
jgi:hypothetical protein